MNISCLIAFVRGLLSCPFFGRAEKLRKDPAFFLMPLNRINDFAETGIRKYWKALCSRIYMPPTDAGNLTRCNFYVATTVAIHIIAQKTAFFSSFSSNRFSSVPFEQYSKQIVILLKEWHRRLIAFLTIKLLGELCGWWVRHYDLRWQMIAKGCPLCIQRIRLVLIHLNAAFFVKEVQLLLRNTASEFQQAK